MVPSADFGHWTRSLRDICSLQIAEAGGRISVNNLYADRAAVNRVIASNSMARKSAPSQEEEAQRLQNRKLWSNRVTSHYFLNFELDGGFGFVDVSSCQQLPVKHATLCRKLLQAKRSELTRLDFNQSPFSEMSVLTHLSSSKGYGRKWFGEDMRIRSPLLRSREVHLMCSPAILSSKSSSAE